jgi:hypothetical protein
MEETRLGLTIKVIVLGTELASRALIILGTPVNRVIGIQTNSFVIIQVVSVLAIRAKQDNGVCLVSDAVFDLKRASGIVVMENVICCTLQTFIFYPRVLLTIEHILGSGLALLVYDCVLVIVGLV